MPTTAPLTAGGFGASRWPVIPWERPASQAGSRRQPYLRPDATWALIPRPPELAGGSLTALEQQFDEGTPRFGVRRASVMQAIQAEGAG